MKAVKGAAIFVNLQCELWAMALAEEFVSRIA
jgi:hypothetical protein